MILGKRRNRMALEKVVNISEARQRKEAQTIGIMYPVGTWIHFCRIAKRSIHLSPNQNSCSCGARKPGGAA